MLVYVQRNHNNEIIAVFKQPTADAQEAISSNDPDLQHFLESTPAPEAVIESLKQSDLEMVRVIEDLINILIEKNIICFTDFPDASQSKIIARQKIRENLRGLL